MELRVVSHALITHRQEITPCFKKGGLVPEWSIDHAL